MIFAWQESQVNQTESISIDIGKCRRIGRRSYYCVYLADHIWQIRHNATRIGFAHSIAAHSLFPAFSQKSPNDPG